MWQMNPLILNVDAVALVSKWLCVVFLVLVLGVHRCDQQTLPSSLIDFRCKFFSGIKFRIVKFSFRKSKK